jgi:L-amino acid N-acyltransferase YncA
LSRAKSDIRTLEAGQLEIRIAKEADFEQIWSIFSDVASPGDTYAYEVDCTKVDAHTLWMQQPRQTYVATLNDQVLGTYYIKTNHAGPGKHVCNCGYMVSASARGMGLATRMCIDSQKRARAFAYQAMQFNFVAASNEDAVRLWLKLGFDEVGRLPKAFNHPSLGMVDALIMFKKLS